MSAQCKRFTMQNQPLVSYYIQRSSGTLVPLLPADQLPLSVDLQGIPRTLRPDQVFGLIAVGELPDPTSMFQLDNSTPAAQSFTNPPTGPSSYRRERRGPELARPLNPEALPHRPGTAGMPYRGNVQPTPLPAPVEEQQTSWRNRTENNTEDSDFTFRAILNSGVGKATAARNGYKARPEVFTPLGKLINPDDKEFCTYWIRTGECDYEQQGCRYKHNMPDLATLNKIGFRTTPRWYVEKHAKVTIGAGTATFPGDVQTSKWLRPVKRGRDGEGGSDDEGCTTDESDDDVSEATSGADESVTEEVEQSKVAETNKAVQEKSKPNKSPAQPLIAEKSSSHVKVVQDLAIGPLIDFGEEVPPAPVPTPTSPAKTIDKVAYSSRQGKKSPTTPSQPLLEPDKKANRSSAPRPRQPSTDSEPLPPPSKIAGLQKTRLNEGRRQQGLMASMHATGNGEAVGRTQYSYRGRGGRPMRGGYGGPIPSVSR